MAHNTAGKMAAWLDEDQRVCVGPAKQGQDVVSLDVADMCSLMKFRCGDPMFPEDYARLDALRPGTPWPRREEPKNICDMPAYAWNRRELAEQLGVKPKDLEEIISLPGCPTRRANGRWPTQEVAQFMMDYIKREMEKVASQNP